MSTSARPRRVLVADDEPALLDAYRRVLDGLLRRADRATAEMNALEAELFGSGEVVPDEHPLDDVDYCRQGEQAVQEVQRALLAGRPFAVVFLDMRMPPGIDGLEAARQIRALDANTNIVIVTGYSDHKPAEITAAVGQPDRLFYFLKPFDADELQQLTVTLANRWVTDIGMAEELAMRVVELERMNTALKASEAHAHEMARVDVLTGLSNRLGLRERFTEAASAATADGRHLSILYLDLDRFKNVNDSLGHPAGDQLIREFARRITQAAGDDAFAARLGGDEFAVICLDHARTAALTERLLDVCREPFTMLGRTVGTSASVGVAHVDPASADLDEAMRRADIALYAAKDGGRGKAREFEPAMDQDVLGTQILMLELAQAVARDELTLHYQPMVGGAGEPIHGVEALLRWNHPVRGQIPPAEFIPLAEKTDLIRELGAWVIRRAFADSRAWPELLTAINLSPAQFRAPDFVDWVIGLAARMNVNAAMIEFEITETVLIENLTLAAEQVSTLKRAGFQIALDDFGSGHAGFSYLSQIPFDRLKIDKSFVQDLSTRDGAGGVVGSIVSLGRAMGLTVTAEGVEERSQQELLQAVGCSQMQGFLFHKPMTADQILDLRRAEQSGRRTA